MFAVPETAGRQGKFSGGGRGDRFGGREEHGFDRGGGGRGGGGGGRYVEEWPTRTVGEEATRKWGHEGFEELVHSEPEPAVPAKRGMPDPTERWVRRRDARSWAHAPVDEGCTSSAQADFNGTHLTLWRPGLLFACRKCQAPQTRSSESGLARSGWSGCWARSCSQLTNIHRGNMEAAAVCAEMERKNSLFALGVKRKEEGPTPTATTTRSRSSSSSSGGAADDAAGRSDQQGERRISRMTIIFGVVVQKLRRLPCDSFRRRGCSAQ